MSVNKISRFFSQFKKYLFSYKDGFFELPYLEGSPQMMVDSFDSMPFMKHNKTKQYVAISNLFMKGRMYYHKLEEGIWVIYGDVNYKANISFKRVDDKALKKEFFFLSLEQIITNRKTVSAITNGIPYGDSLWVLQKPKDGHENCYLKETKAISCVLYFTKKWAEKMIDNDAVFAKSNLHNFFESKEKFFVCSEEANVTKELLASVGKFFVKKINGKEQGLEQANKMVRQIFYQFIEGNAIENRNKNFFNVTNSNRIKIIEAERILVEMLEGKFIGIENLSKKVAISPTQLKYCFKLMYGKSVFQYFRVKQLEYAKKILMNETASVKEVASLLGYVNSSKFAKAFKNQFNTLPSGVGKIN